MLRGFRHYDRIAASLHWIIAVGIIAMLPLGFFMGDLPESIRGTGYGIHKSLGITIITLSIFRLIWRLLNPPSSIEITTSKLEKVTASTVHWLLYFVMIAMPLTGWLMVSASRKYPTEFFGLFEVPFIPMPPDINPKATAGLFDDMHYYLAYGAIALITLHIAAAIRHMLYARKRPTITIH